MGGVILMAISLYQPQKWIMPYRQKQKQGFVKMKKSCKDFILLQLATYCPSKVLHFQRHLENDTSGLLCFLGWSYANLWHIPLFPNFLVICSSLFPLVLLYAL